MIEQVLPDLYRLQIPLPNSPLKSVNSYLIAGNDHFLIIDTGMNREECLNPLLNHLSELGVVLDRTDFFITHFHSDHIGLLGRVATKSSRIFFNETEGQLVNRFLDEDAERGKERLSRAYDSHGFPGKELVKALSSHPGFRFRVRGHFNFTLLKEGDLLEIGDYTFKCLETPGHSPGHMCLYEPVKKILVSGDHILFDITPNITIWPDMKNSLKVYLTSLEKIYSLDTHLVLPGHRNIQDGHRQRIRELQEHHHNRLNEIITALNNKNKNAWEVAQSISWEIDCDSWDLFPPAQKWFALGETIAHLDFLEEEDRVVRIERDNHIYFSLK